MVDLSISTGALDTLLCDESDDHQHGLLSIKNLTSPGCVFRTVAVLIYLVMDISLDVGHCLTTVDSYLDE